MSEIRLRSEIQPQDTWDLEAMYLNDDAWEADLAAFQSRPEQIARWKGRLHESPSTLASALAEISEAERKIQKIYVYAHLRHDQDLEDSKYQQIYDRARNLYHQLSTATAFVDPQLLELEEATLRAWSEDPALQRFRRYLRDLLQRKAHTLSQAEERLLAMAEEALSGTEKVFSLLENVEIPARFPEIRTPEGRMQKLTHAGYYKLMQSQDREIRREIYRAFYGEFRGNRNSLAATLDGKLKANLFKAKARKYPSAREMFLFPDRVPCAVYDHLITSIRSRFPDLYRYLALRRKALGLHDLHMYDQSVSIVTDIELHFTWEEAETLVCDSLLPLGDEYQAILREGFRKRWIDRYENRGKRTGAYSSGCYDSMPYILHNFNGTLQSVFTLAHEIGHSMHSALSNRTQPYEQADYRIFVAEVASTTNEALLNHHLLQKYTDPKIRAYLLNHYLTDFRSTMFRQTMFAEFERDIYASLEGGEAALTADGLDERYFRLVKDYFGPEIAWDGDDALIAWEWARIPHFYYGFYVYKYATGMAAATALSQAILTEGQPAIDRTLRFLRAGGSKDPLEILQDAGVDLTTSAPVDSALDCFRQILEELETLVAR